MSRPQALAVGAGPRAIESWLATGRLHTVHRGVYAVGRPDLPRDGRWMAALLRCGPDAVLEGRSAAALWGLRRSSESRISIAVRGAGARHPSSEIALRRRRALHDDEITRVRGLAVTTPARTLLDLAGILPADDLRSAVRNAEQLRVFDARALHAVLAAHPRSPGRGALRRMLADLEAWDPVTLSGLELAFTELVRRHGLPRPVMNTLVAGQLVDAYWPSHGVVVELDGYAAHGTRQAFRRDRRRTNDLQLSGRVVLRFTHADVTADAAATAGRIHAALAARRG